jgi:uncharacterized protein
VHLDPSPAIAGLLVGFLVGLTGMGGGALLTPLLVGALPGVYLGARLSAQGPAGVIRPVLAGVLLASALVLLQVGTPVIIAGAIGGCAVAAALSYRRPITLPAAPVTQLDPVH